MYNLLISMGVAVALLGLGWGVTGTAIAGVIPAILGMGVAYFLLARRSGKQLQAIMNRAMAEFGALQNVQAPRTQSEANKLRQLQLDKIAKGREILEEGFALAPWQFLVGKQIHAQIGAIEYMQMNWEAAREQLLQAWSRNWQAMAMLSCIDHREKKHDEALGRMEEAKGPGKKDPLFWGLYAWLALKAGKRDLAVRVANEGLQSNEGSDALKAIAAAIANKKPVKVDGFDPGWYQFFPEQSPQYRDAQKQANKHGNAPNVRRGGYTFPHPRR
jgi:preprotein translocase subunit YajC